MATIKKYQVLERTWRNWDTCSLLVGISDGAAAVESSMGAPSKLKIDSLYDSMIPLLGVYLKELKEGLEDLFVHSNS